MDELTGPMRAALDIIKNNEVTYRYRPMRHSVSRPVRVTPSDLTPVYSHGLNARTVEALISWSAVRLSARDQNHGRVLAS